MPKSYNAYVAKRLASVAAGALMAIAIMGAMAALLAAWLAFLYCIKEHTADTLLVLLAVALAVSLYWLRTVREDYRRSHDGD